MRVAFKIIFDIITVMKKNISFLLCMLVCFYLAGCSSLQEKARVIWGSSTKALNEARSTAQEQTFMCSYKECFDQVLEASHQAGYKVFIKDPRKQIIVLMNIPGSIETTEVGIFFDESSDGQTLIQVSSLSFRAKQTAAAEIFDHLQKIDFQK